MSEKYSSSSFITGVDEAGRGALAGPVVAACAVSVPELFMKGLLDSKLLTEKKRDALFSQLCNELKDFSYSAVDNEAIDLINIRQATLLAMKNSHNLLTVMSDNIIVDGVDAPIPGSRAQIKADRDLPIVSAASIIAKVMRDRIMLHYHSLYPQYRFDLHKGYPTVLHKKMIAEHGYTPIHRRSYNCSLVRGD